ncbi:hypothetical protein AYO47_02460 [Planctomyces sp. SCGC AG-212-M04]|nr:hypothetical protein AYO47_02460 [Planctomyces sp. SCGC AG-212-M04]
MQPSVYAIATMDTKGEEITFVARRLEEAGALVTVVDVGTQGPATAPSAVPRDTVAACHPKGASFVLNNTDRGAAVEAMSEALDLFLKAEHDHGRVQGVIGIGGSGGTALITRAMRSLPVGLPKLMVSTVASGNVSPYVDCGDICMMPSVVDVAGINAVSSRVLANAAHAMAGMVAHETKSKELKPIVGMTMFGVTTPCVTAIRAALESKGFDCLVFHATGTGGRAMEKLVESGLIKAVLDVTTTEVADEVVGGVFAAGPKRFESILRSRVPYVMSMGALDMVNFGAPDTVPPKFQGRLFHGHNANVTLMRTTPEENREFARWIAGKLKQAKAPVVVLIPEKGVSALDAAGQAFHDPQADAALFDQFELETRGLEHVTVHKKAMHVNDPAFAATLVEEFTRLWNR